MPTGGEIAVELAHLQLSNAALFEWLSPAWGQDARSHLIMYQGKLQRQQGFCWLFLRKPWRRRFVLGLGVALLEVLMKVIIRMLGKWVSDLNPDLLTQGLRDGYRKMTHLKSLFGYRI